MIEFYKYCMVYGVMLFAIYALVFGLIMDDSDVVSIKKEAEKIISEYI